MYNGKKGIRGEGERYEYTPEMVKDFIRCKEDIIHFAEKYFYIVSIDEGKHKIKLFDFQRKALKLFVGPDDNIVLMPRQMGKCLFGDTIVKIKNRKTGDIRDIQISDLFDSIIAKTIG